jgi:hypothetical protein
LLAHYVVHEVILLSILAEIFLGVVNDIIGSKVLDPLKI